MADSEQLNYRLLREIEQLNKNLGGYGRAMADAAKKHERNNRPRGETPRDGENDWADISDRVASGWSKSMGVVSGAAIGVAKGFTILTKGTESATDAFTGLSKMLLGGAIGGVLIGTLTNYTTGLQKTFQTLSDQGRTFSGDIFAMAQAAASAGTTLEEYARINQRNSVVAARMMGNGSGGLAGFAKQIRDSSRQFGMFGMTIQDIDDLVGDYADTMRMQNRLDELDTTKGRAGFIGLTAEATALSQALGTNRKQTMANAAEAMRSSQMSARLALMGGEERKEAGDAFNKAIVGFAAQAGEAGKMFSQMFAQTAAYDGHAYNTDAARTLFNKIMPEATTMMERTYSQILSDKANTVNYQNEYIKSLRSSIEAQMENLLLTSQGTGEAAANAKRMLDIYQSIKDVKDVDKVIGRLQHEYSESLTQVMGSMDDVWTNLKAGILSKILPMIAGPVRAFADGIMKFIKSDAYTRLSNTLAAAGATFDVWVKTWMENGGLDKFATWAGKAGDYIANFVVGLSKVNWEALGEQVSGVFDVLKGVFGSLVTIGTSVTTVLGFFKNHMEGLILAVIGAATALGTLYAASKVADIYKAFSGLREMTVKAGIVNVNGKTSAGGGDFGGGEGKKGKKGEHAHRSRSHGRWGLIAGITSTALGLGASAIAIDKLAKSATSASDALDKTGTGAKNLGEPMDDFNRQLLDMKAETGTLSPAEKAQRDADIELRKQIRDQRQQQSQAASPTGHGTSTPPSIATPLQKAAETTDAVGALASSAGNAIGTASKWLGETMTTVGGAGGLLTKIAPVVLGASKVIPMVGAGISAVAGAYNLNTLKKRRDNGEITDEDFKKQLSQLAIDTGIDVAAGLVGGPAGLAIKGISAANNIGGMLGFGTAGDYGANAVVGKKGIFGQVIDGVADAISTGPKAPEVVDLEKKVTSMREAIERNETQKKLVGSDPLVAKNLSDLNMNLESLLKATLQRLDDLNATTSRSGTMTARAITNGGS